MDQPINVPARPMPVQLSGGSDLHLYGYWAHPTADITIKVPVLPHAFYPKLSHGREQVRNVMEYREVVLPSIRSLKHAGYDVDKVIMLAEINVHERHEKNMNFFRFELPSVLRTVAQREGVTFLLIANDNPSAKLKRKVVLELWRNKFTPLFIKGKQFVSGRMNYFIVPNNPNVLQGLKKALNMESRGEANANLVEAYIPRRFPVKYAPTNSPKGKVNIVAKNLVVGGGEELTQDLIDNIEYMLDQKLAPTILQKIPNAPSEFKKDLHSILGDREVAQDLRNQYQAARPSQRAAAFKAWAQRTLDERIIPTAKTYGAHLANEVIRNVTTALMAAAVQSLLGTAFSKSPDFIKDRVTFEAPPIRLGLPGANIDITTSRGRQAAISKIGEFDITGKVAELLGSRLESFVIPHIMPTIEVTSLASNALGYQVSLNRSKWLQLIASLRQEAEHGNPEAVMLFRYLESKDTEVARLVADINTHLNRMVASGEWPRRSYGGWY